MNKKIEVDVTELPSGYMALKGHDPSRSMIAATLIIGERGFSNSEVIAMAMKAIRAIKHDMPNDASVGIAVGNIAKALSDAGIVLDPA